MPDRTPIKFTMENTLSTAKRVPVVSALVEGNSLRATARMAGVSRNTVNALLLDLGAACTAQQGEALKNSRPSVSRWTRFGASSE
jgi:transposase-like protein